MLANKCNNGLTNISKLEEKDISLRTCPLQKVMMCIGACIHFVLLLCIFSQGITGSKIISQYLDFWLIFWKAMKPNVFHRPLLLLKACFQHLELVGRFTHKTTSLSKDWTTWQGHCVTNVWPLSGTPVNASHSDSAEWQPTRLKHPSSLPWPPKEAQNWGEEAVGDEAKDYITHICT